MRPGEPVEPVEPVEPTEPVEPGETDVTFTDPEGTPTEIPDQSGTITDPSMIPEWLVIAAAGAGIAWPALVELSRGKTPEEVVEIILTYPGAGGGNPNDTDNRGGGGAGHRGGPGGNPQPGPYGTGPFSQTPLSSLRGDASFGHPSQMSMFSRGGGGGGLYEQMGPGIWDLPSMLSSQWGFEDNSGGYGGAYSR